MSRRFLTVCGLVGLITGGPACQRPTSVQPGDWPQFRGPGGLGISMSENLPQRWGEDGDNILWKTRIPGKGNSSPIVSHGRVFLTTSNFVGKKQVRKSALGLVLESGQILWQTEIERGPRSKRHHVNTHAAPTPVTDGRHVFVHFGDVLASLDRDGQILWKVTTDPDFVRYSHYGAASSLVLTERAVIVAQDREEAKEKLGWLAAFDKETGEELWRATWEDTCCSYVTPLLRHHNSRREIVFPMAGSVRAFDSLTGESLWSTDFTTDQPVASPVIEGDLLAVFSGAHTRRFGAVYRLSGAGADTDVETLWDTNRMIPQTSSPVMYDGRVYTVTEQGVMVCRDGLTGKQHWKRRLPPGTYRSSLLAGDGKIYAVSSTGSTAVIAAGNTFETLSNNILAEGGNASPAVAGDTILIRTDKALYRIGSESN